MNIALEQTEEYVNGQKTNEYGDAFVRGNNGAPSFRGPSCSTFSLSDLTLFDTQCFTFPGSHRTQCHTYLTEGVTLIPPFTAAAAAAARATLFCTLPRLLCNIIAISHHKGSRSDVSQRSKLSVAYHVGSYYMCSETRKRNRGKGLTGGSKLNCLE